MTAPMTREELLAKLGEIADFAEGNAKAAQAENHLIDSDTWRVHARKVREVTAALRGIAQTSGWQPIETAPKGELVDLWTVGWGAEPLRAADCYYDHICDEWRTSRPAGQLMCIKARYVTHWAPRPAPPSNQGASK